MVELQRSCLDVVHHLLLQTFVDVRPAAHFTEELANSGPLALAATADVILAQSASIFRQV